jgi:hypothetical protein
VTCIRSELTVRLKGEVLRPLHQLTRCQLRTQFADGRVA